MLCIFIMEKSVPKLPTAMRLLLLTFGLKKKNLSQAGRLYITLRPLKRLQAVHSNISEAEAMTQTAKLFRLMCIRQSNFVFNLTSVIDKLI